MKDFITLLLLTLLISTAMADEKMDEKWRSFEKKRGQYLDILAQSVLESIAKKDTEHSVFHGCYDWHSAVHGHWALLRAYRVTGRKDFLTAVKKSMTAKEIHEERLYLQAHPTFEMPYGRAWFLLLIQEYEQVTEDRIFRDFADEVAVTLVDYLAPKAFANEREYQNQAWAYRRLLEYYNHTKNKQQQGHVRNLLDDKLDLENPPAVSLSQDYSKADFFSRWGNFVHLLDLHLPEQSFRRWLARNTPAERDLKPVEKLFNAHHLSINYARAWAFWSIFRHSKDEKYRQAYIAHIEKGFALHQQYQHSYREYSHWVPQFGIYAISICLEEQNNR